MNRWAGRIAIVILATAAVVVAVASVWVSAQPGASQLDTPESVARRFYELAGSGNAVAASGLVVNRWDFLLDQGSSSILGDDYWSGLSGLTVDPSYPSSLQGNVSSSKFADVRELSVEFTAASSTSTRDAGQVTEFMILVRRYPSAPWQILGEPGSGP